jgi:hypothetical protein
MSYKDMPHAAVNEAMKWVRERGKQVMRLRAWPQLARWSALPDWYAHIDVRGTRPLHISIKRQGYKFRVTRPLDDLACPACQAASLPSASIQKPAS